LLFSFLAEVNQRRSVAEGDLRQFGLQLCELLACPTDGQLQVAAVDPPVAVVDDRDCEVLKREYCALRCDVAVRVRTLQPRREDGGLVAERLAVCQNDDVLLPWIGLKRYVAEAVILENIFFGTHGRRSENEQ